MLLVKARALTPAAHLLVLRELRPKIYSLWTSLRYRQVQFLRIICTITE